MSATGKRVLGLSVATLVVCVLIGLYIGLYLVNVPGSAAAVRTSSGDNLYLATVPAAALNDPHPTWVSYYAINSSGGDWRHVTTYVLPANSTIHVTIYNYDSQTGLRNGFLSQSEGTGGGVINVDGQSVQGINPDAASHVFAIPGLGVSVPILGISGTAKNPCSNAPCAESFDHTTTSFTIHTGKPGYYQWQCFVPCAAGFIAGLGGPMQTVGYMDGYIKVV